MRKPPDKSPTLAEALGRNPDLIGFRFGGLFLFFTKYERNELRNYFFLSSRA
jgi:hypothetical protein